MLSTSKGAYPKEFADSITFFWIYEVNLVICISVRALVLSYPRLCFKNKNFEGQLIRKFWGTCLKNTAKYWKILQFTTSYCKYCKILQNSVKYCKILQKIAKILQNISKYYKIPKNTANYVFSTHMFVSLSSL
jgi:hypothetical protein